MAYRLSAITTAFTLTAIAAVVSPAAASSGQLLRWQFDPETRQLELIVTAATQPNYFILAQPPRIIVDFPGTTLGPVLEEQRYGGIVRQIRVNQFQPTLTRVVIELDEDAELAAQQVQVRPLDTTSTRWAVRPLLAGDRPSSLTTDLSAPDSQDDAIALPPENDGGDSPLGETTDETPPLEPGGLELVVETADAAPFPAERSAVSGTSDLDETSDREIGGGETRNREIADREIRDRATEVELPVQMDDDTDEGLADRGFTVANTITFGATELEIADPIRLEASNSMVGPIVLQADSVALDDEAAEPAPELASEDVPSALETPEPSPTPDESEL
ncbi:MAG: AMIN domain-containing protein, partial [Cyanobacteria bacterium P01_A01_bin.135]